MRAGGGGSDFHIKPIDLVINDSVRDLAESMATPREVDTHARTFIHHFSLHQTINSSMDSRHAICCLGLSRNVGSVDSLNWNVHSICLSDNLNGNLHNFSINEKCEYFVDGNGSGNDLSFLGLGGGGIGGCCCAIRSDICNDRP